MILWIVRFEMIFHTRVWIICLKPVQQIDTEERYKQELYVEMPNLNLCLQWAPMAQKRPKHFWLYITELDIPSKTGHLAAQFWAPSHLYPCNSFSLNNICPHQHTAKAAKSKFNFPEWNQAILIQYSPCVNNLYSQMPAQIPWENYMILRYQDTMW